MILFIVNCFLFIYIIFKFKRHYSLLLFFPFILHFMINILGVFNLYYFSDVTTVGIHVSQDVREQIFDEFFISYLILNLSFLFFVKVVGSNKLNDDVEKYLSSDVAYSISKRLVILTVSILFIDSFIYGMPAGYYSLTGGFEMAAFQKGVIIKEKIANGIPFFGYLVNYLPYLTFIHVLLYFLKNGNGKFLLCIVLASFIVYGFLSLVKSYLLTPLIFCLWVFFVFERLKIRYLLVSLLAITATLLILFSSLAASDADILYLVFKRVFLVQPEGMYLIRDFYKQQDLGALFYSSPLRHFLDFSVFDPAAVIVEHYFGRDSGWVNMNSFYSGQGFVMFGYYYILIVPALIFGQYLVIIKFLKLFLNPGLVFILLMGLMIFLPLSNNIANVVWLKDFFASMIILPFLKSYKLHI